VNPELRRNLWLQFSGLRLIIAPVATGIVLLLVWLATHSPAILADSARWIYLLVVLIWGTRRAADLVAEETAGGTWDSQRMSALGAWQMTWGKFIGGISYVWYIAGLAFAIHVWARGLAGAMPWQGDEAVDDLHLIGTGLLGQAVSFVTSLVLLRKQIGRRRLGVTLSQVAGLGASAIASGHLDLSALFRRMAVIDWFGRPYPGAEFALVTLCLFLAWSLLGAYRLMRIELQFRTIPWAWAAFALFVMAYAEGLLYGPIHAAGNSPGPWLSGPFVIGVLLTYAALFLEPKDVVRYRGLWAALAAGRMGRAVTLLPQWLAVYLIAAALGIAVAVFGGFSELPGIPAMVVPVLGALELGVADSWRVLPVALVLYLMRDILIVLFFNFGARGGRADMTAFVCLMLAYFPVLWILALLGANALIPLVAPYPAASPLITIGAPMIECSIMVVLVLWRAQAAGRFRPAAA